MILFCLILSIFSIFILTINWITKDNDISPIDVCILFISGITLLLCSFTIENVYNSDNYYNPNCNELIIHECEKHDNYAKYTYNVIDTEGIRISENCYFIDHIGKYDIGDTIIFNKK
jgi:hypothetical protein